VWVTQQQILDAAEMEFARDGLKGARLSAIAHGAKIRTAIIHYYFENNGKTHRKCDRSNFKRLEEGDSCYATVTGDSRKINILLSPSS
jgi:hypothetical protein